MSTDSPSKLAAEFGDYRDSIDAILASGGGQNKKPRSPDGTPSGDFFAYYSHATPRESPAFAALDKIFSRLKQPIK